MGMADLLPAGLSLDLVIGNIAAFMGLALVTGVLGIYLALKMSPLVVRTIKRIATSR